MRIGSYAETSPSGTGIKVFCLIAVADVPTLRQAMATEHGKRWTRGGGEHPPGIEVYMSNRYFAVTDEHLPDTPADLRPVSLDTLLWIIREAAPAFLAAELCARQHGRPRRRKRSVAQRHRLSEGYRPAPRWQDV